MVWAAEHVIIWEYQIGVSLYALLINIIFGQFCFQLAACACFQAQPAGKRQRCERFGQALVLAVGVL
eukprot:COSAG01_NODE_51413_length_355_cov_0.605469_1_plen_66_part_01